MNWSWEASQRLESRRHMFVDDKHGTVEVRACESLKSTAAFSIGNQTEIIVTCTQMET